MNLYPIEYYYNENLKTNSLLFLKIFFFVKWVHQFTWTSVSPMEKYCYICKKKKLLRKKKKNTGVSLKKNSLFCSIIISVVDPNCWSHYFIKMFSPNPFSCKKWSSQLFSSYRFFCLSQFPSGIINLSIPSQSSFTVAHDHGQNKTYFSTFALRSLSRFSCSRKETKSNGQHL